MSVCEDCGCRVYGGICSNCEEELYIYTNQAEDSPAFSDEFMDAVRDQQIARNQKHWSQAHER